MNVTLGNYSATGPRCMLQQWDGIRAGRCLDGGSSNFQPGGETQIYPCMREWYQFVSFGDGRIAPAGSMYSTIPSHIVKQIQAKGHAQIPYMCLGVFERGDQDESDWDEDTDDEANPVDASLLNETSIAASKATTGEWLALSEFKGSRAVMTQCTNVGAVIEWVFVPFIFEEGQTMADDVESVNSSSSANSTPQLDTDVSYYEEDDQEL